MRALYLVSVWLHILAAATWFGGIAFIVLVVVPWLRRGGREHAGVFLRETGGRLRAVGWACFAVLIVTGTFNLWMRGVRVDDFLRREWIASSFGRTLLLKLSVFGVVLLLGVVHDFFVGPQAARAIAEAPGSPRTQALRRRASLLGRINALLALVLVGLAVMVVRGTP